MIIKHLLDLFSCYKSIPRIKTRKIGTLSKVYGGPIDFNVTMATNPMVIISTKGEQKNSRNLIF